MTSIDDFINWWQGFRDAIDPANITQEHLDMIDRKINGLQDLWDIKLPSIEEQFDDGRYITDPDGRFPPVTWPPMWRNNPFPSVPQIWCGQPFHVGTPQDQPHVGTPLTHVN